MNIQLNLAVKLIIQESETAMQTQRLVRQAWFGLISALLGSVFGLLRTFATGMALFERFVERYRRKQKMMIVLKSTADQGINLKSAFGRFRVWKKSIKVTPTAFMNETIV